MKINFLNSWNVHISVRFSRSEISVLLMSGLLITNFDIFTNILRKGLKTLNHSGNIGKIWIKIRHYLQIYGLFKKLLKLFWYIKLQRRCFLKRFWLGGKKSNSVGGGMDIFGKFFIVAWLFNNVTHDHQFFLSFPSLTDGLL